MRSWAFSGSFSLTTSPQILRTKSALYTKGPPPNRTFSDKGKADWNTGNYVWHRTEAIADEKSLGDLRWTNEEP